MIYTEPIMFPGTEEIVENFDYYKNKFINNSFLVFRNANLNSEEHSAFHKTLGDLFGWYTNESPAKKLYSYTENHSHNDEINIAGKDDVMLKWHIEHVYYKNPIVASTWNMSTFTTDSDNGKTYFVDSEKVYNAMSDDWKHFLLKCITNTIEFDNKNGNSTMVKYDYNVIKNHWLTENPLIRMRVLKDSESPSALVLFDGQEPTQEQTEKFNEISFWFSNQVKNNEDIRIVHRWEQGDLFVPDMFKLAHAVTGGFDPKDRQFTGIWGHQFNDFTFLIPN